MMESQAFQKIYTQLINMTKATVTLKAKGVGYDEMAMVHGRRAQVVKLMGDLVTLQVFAGTKDIPTNAEVTFLARPHQLKVSDELGGRLSDAYGDRIDGGSQVEGELRDIGTPPINPVRRKL